MLIYLGLIALVFSAFNSQISCLWKETTSTKLSIYIQIHLMSHDKTKKPLPKVLVQIV